MSDKKNYKQLYMVDDYKKDGESKSSYTKLGVAFENRDGSYILHMKAVPVTGRILMRDPYEPKGRDSNNVRPFRRDSGYDSDYREERRA